MSGDKTKIIEILSKAKPRSDTDSPYSRIKLFLAVLVFMVIVEIIFSFYKFNQLKADNLDVAARLEQQQTNTKELLARQKSIGAYRDNLPIKNLCVINSGDHIKLSGYIENRGVRAVNDIDISVYCIDRNDLPVYVQIFTVQSSDGNPLTQYQRRKFSVTIVDPPPSSKNSQVIVSDIAFHHQEEGSSEGRQP